MHVLDRGCLGFMSFMDSMSKKWFSSETLQKLIQSNRAVPLRCWLMSFIFPWLAVKRFYSRWNLEQLPAGWVWSEFNASAERQRSDSLLQYNRMFKFSSLLLSNHSNASFQLNCYNHCFTLNVYLRIKLVKTNKSSTSLHKSLTQ